MDSEQFEILRRHFVAIATDKFDDPNYESFGEVKKEVEVLRGWLCDTQLGERRFDRFSDELSGSPTLDAIRAALENPPAERRFRGADAVVVYVTGHGDVKDGKHWLILRQTEYGRTKATALETAALIGWLAETDVEHLLVIIDVCHAGYAGGPLTQFEDALPSTWIGLFASTPQEEAEFGRLAHAVQEFLDELAASEKYGSALEPYIKAEEFVIALARKLNMEGQRLVAFPHIPIGASPCLPHPRYARSEDTRLPTAARRSDMAVRRDDLLAHWDPRARGVQRDDEPGWFFSGRRRLMQELIAAAGGPPGAIAITGSAGCGKSAALSRLVTLSDTEFRERYTDQVANIPDDLQPQPDAVDVAILATGKTSAQVVQQLCEGLGVDVADGDGTVAARLTDLHKSLEGRSEPVTVVVDALDEAQDALDLVRSVLQRLEPSGSPDKVRLIVGVRSVRRDAAAAPGHQEREALGLAEIVVEALHAGEAAADAEPYWVDEDLEQYVFELLLVAPPGRDASPYSGREDLARKVARDVSLQVGRSYLAARIVARSLARRERVEVPDDLTIGTELREVLRADIERLLSSDADRRRAVDLLSAVAFAFGRGMPWRTIWPEVARALNPERGYGDADIDWLLKQPISGYLVRDLENDVTVYRLLNTALRDALRSEPDWFLREGQHDGEQV